MENINRINGVIALHKPNGITSFEDVNKIKNLLVKYYEKQLNSKLTRKQYKKLIKVDHGGTLDKNAEGVLVVFSTLKKKGVRISDLVRKGIKVKIESRKVMIYDLKILEFDSPRFKIRASVGGETYIRNLIRDIGSELGSCAYMEDLIRIKQGDFVLADAVKFGDLSIEAIKKALKINHY